MPPSGPVSVNTYLRTACGTVGRLTFWSRGKIFERFNSCWAIPTWKRHPFICTCRPSICIRSPIRWRRSLFPPSTRLSGPAERRKNEPARRGGGRHPPRAGVVDSSSDIKAGLRVQQLKVMRAISRCRTASLGGHIDKCLRCGKDWGLSFNSCRNRHCPKCQAQSRQRWIEARENELLATSLCAVSRYVVFNAERSDLADSLSRNAT